MIHLRPKPANDTPPLGGCDCCHATDHDSSAHRSPVAAMAMAEKHEAAAAGAVMGGLGKPDPDGKRGRLVMHHRTMAEMWKRTAMTIANRLARKGTGK